MIVSWATHSHSLSHLREFAYDIVDSLSNIRTQRGNPQGPPFLHHSLQADTISGDKLGSFSLSAHFQGVTQRLRESRLAQQAERHRARKQQAKQAAVQAAAQAAALAACEAETRREAEEAERRAAPARGSGLQGAAQGSTSATKAIQKELAKMFALQTGAKGQSSLPAGGFEVELPEEENLYRWRVKLRPSLFAGSTLEAVRAGLA